MPSNSSQHPTPAEAYKLGALYAAILRHLYTHPEFKYQEPPTAVISKVDLDQTPQGLFFTTDFIQNTNVIPLLPQGATRKCKELANPWAYADTSYQWEWTWDADAGEMKDADGNVIAFPKLPASKLKGNFVDLGTRSFLTKKLVLENGTDLQARMMLGGRAIDFGEEARAAVQKLD